jgi:DedD protein
MDRRVKERLVGASILVVLIVLIVPELLSGPPGPAPAAVGPRLPVSTRQEPVRNVTVDLATSKTPEPDPAAAETAASSAQPPEARRAESASAEAGADSSTDTGSHAAPPADAPSAVSPPADVSPAVSPRADAPSADTPRSAAPPKTASSVPLETAAPAPISASVAKPAMAAKPAKPAMAGRSWAVQLGSFASHANADKLVRQMKAQGFSVYIVPGGSGPSLRYRVRIGPMADRGAATQAIAKLKATGQAASLVAPAP